MSKLDATKVLAIAMVCHQANKAWCESNGDDSQKDWAEAEEWQRESAIAGVDFRLNNPNAGDDAQHNAWMQDKLADGWVYGPEKNPELKTHPCLVPFDQLPEFQQKKDALFCAIVDALVGITVIERHGHDEANEDFDNSVGAQRVRVKFNPGNNDVVQNLKEAGAHMINRIEKFRSIDAKNPSELNRTVSLAQTNIEDGIMWAVKAATSDKN